MNDALVRVIVVNYNAGPYLQRCIHALIAQTYSNFEIVIIDNASMDGSLATVPNDPRLRIERLTRNVGFASANNLAARDATAAFLAFLNPDAIPEPNWLERLTHVMTRMPNVHLVGSLQLRDDDTSRIDGAGDVYFFTGAAWRDRQHALRQTVAGYHCTFGVCAAAALIRRHWFERLGGFDEDYFCYFEDVDLAFRLRLIGGTVLQINDAIVRHAGSAIAGVGSDFVTYHSIRNQIWTFFKNMPGPLLIALAPVHVLFVACQWLRALRRGQHRVVARAIQGALRNHRAVLAKRRQIQAVRVASALEIARAMTWSLSAFRRRAGSDA